jgi:hypothetical protein
MSNLVGVMGAAELGMLGLDSRRVGKNSDGDALLRTKNNLCRSRYAL